MKNKWWAIVPAAGIGTRMGAEVPKQYLSLADSTVIEKTLERLLSIEQLSGIVVCLHPQDQHWQQLAIAEHPKIITAPGGGERCDSVRNGLLAICQQSTVKESTVRESTVKESTTNESTTNENIAKDWILVHDAARPCVMESDIGLLIDKLRDHPVGGILGVPASDTLKYIGPGRVIDKTLERSHVWHAQTPQMYRYDVLVQALEQVRVNQFKSTDEASAVEHLGLESLIVEGRRDNLKITRPEDLLLAEFILQRQQKAAD